MATSRSTTEHLAAAVAEYKKGNLAGHSAAEVRRHIKKGAARLGVNVDLGDGDDDEGDRPRRKARKPARGQRGQRAANTDGSEGFHSGGWGDAAGRGSSLMGDGFNSQTKSGNVAPSCHDKAGHDKLRSESKCPGGEEPTHSSQAALDRRPGRSPPPAPGAHPV